MVEETWIFRARVMQTRSRGRKKSQRKAKRIVSAGECCTQSVTLQKAPILPEHIYKNQHMPKNGALQSYPTERSGGTLERKEHDRSRSSLELKAVVLTLTIRLHSRSSVYCVSKKTVPGHLQANNPSTDGPYTNKLVGRDPEK